MHDKPQTFREFFDASLNQETSELNDDEIILLYQMGGMTVRDICEKCKKSIGDVYRILKKRNCVPNRRCLKHDTVASLLDSGFSVQSIADLTGYTPRNVRHVISKNKDK